MSMAKQLTIALLSAAALVFAPISMSVAQTAPPPPAAAAAKPMKSVGKIHSIVDEEVLFGTKIHPTHVEMLSMTGYRKVKSAGKIADRTIFGGWMYISYSVAKEGPSQSVLARLLGKPVELTFKRSPEGRALILSARSK